MLTEAPLSILPAIGMQQASQRVRSMAYATPSHGIRISNVHLPSPETQDFVKVRIAVTPHH